METILDTGMVVADIIIKVIIPILGAIVTVVIIPFIMSKTTKEQRDDVLFWVNVAVRSAEMVYKEKGQGKFKKHYVVEFLNKKGIKISEEELNAMIEAVVKEFNMEQESLDGIEIIEIIE